MTWESGQGGTTYSTTPPASPWTGQRKHSPADRDIPAAPSAPHVHSASDLGMHHGQPTKPSRQAYTISDSTYALRCPSALRQASGDRCPRLYASIALSGDVDLRQTDRQAGESVDLLIPRPSSASKRRHLPQPPAPTNPRGPASLPRHLSARLVARYAGDGCTSESCQEFGPASSMSAQGQRADETGARGSHLKVPPCLLARVEAPCNGLKLILGHLL